VTTTDPISAERLEELLAGAIPEREAEARVQGLARALRADAPAAPERLRARLSSTEQGSTPPRRRSAPLRLALVAVPALIVTRPGSPSRAVVNLTAFASRLVKIWRTRASSPQAASPAA
jgi:hypothetical protein